MELICSKISGGSSLTKKSGRQSTEKTEGNVDNIVKSEDVETEKGTVTVKIVLKVWPLFRFVCIMAVFNTTL